MIKERVPLVKFSWEILGSYNLCCLSQINLTKDQRMAVEINLPSSNSATVSGQRIPIFIPGSGKIPV